MFLDAKPYMGIEICGIYGDGIWEKGEKRWESGIRDLDKILSVIREKCVNYQVKRD